MVGLISFLSKNKVGIAISSEGLVPDFIEVIRMSDKLMQILKKVRLSFF